jgi:hypothetical protein
MEVKSLVVTLMVLHVQAMMHSIEKHGWAWKVLGARIRTIPGKGFVFNLDILKI